MCTSFFRFSRYRSRLRSLTLIVCNLISSWLGWPELSLPWWQQRPGRAAVTISWYVVAGWLGTCIEVVALGGYYARR